MLVDLKFDGSRAIRIVKNGTKCTTQGANRAQGKRLRSAVATPAAAVQLVVMHRGKPIDCNLPAEATPDACAGPQLTVALTPMSVGRCTIDLTYEGRVQSRQLVHLMVMEPARHLLQRYADFSMRKAARVLVRPYPPEEWLSSIWSPRVSHPVFAIPDDRAESFVTCPALHPGMAESEYF